MTETEKKQVTLNDLKEIVQKFESSVNLYELAVKEMFDLGNDAITRFRPGAATYKSDVMMLQKEFRKILQEQIYSVFGPKKKVEAANG